MGDVEAHHCPDGHGQEHDGGHGEPGEPMDGLVEQGCHHEKAAADDGSEGAHHGPPGAGAQDPGADEEHPQSGDDEEQDDVLEHGACR